MGLEARFSASMLAAALERVGDDCARDALQVLRAEAAATQALAKEFVPVDEEMLTAAIKVKEVGGRDALGRFGRRSLQVFVDESMPGSGGAATVGEYAYLMHEGLGPYGDGTFQLGEGSRAKDGGRGIVGGKFLERALELRKTAVARGVELAIERAIRNA